MPVLRYRDVRDVPPPAAVDASDPSLFGRVVALSAFAAVAVGPLYRAGVTRFASLEAAEAAREVALLERMRRRGAAPETSERCEGAAIDRACDCP
jgi:hypothetical protein